MNGKDLFIGLGDISQKYYEKAEMETIAPAVTRRPLRRPILIAAIIAAMLLLAGCTVMYILRIQDMAMDKYTYTPANTEIPAEERTVISLQGYVGSPNYQAAKEWYEFRQSYVLPEEEAEIPMEDRLDYLSYGCFFPEEIAKVDEICEKYGLHPLGIPWIEESIDITLNALGLDGLVMPDAGIEATYPTNQAYYYRDGTFDIAFTLQFTDENAIWCDPMEFRMRYVKKTAFDGVYGQMGPIEDYEQWHYINKQGVDVLMARSSTHGIMIVDREDAFLTVFIGTGSASMAEDAPFPTREALEAAADVIDFLVTPGPVDETAAQARLDATAKRLEEERKSYIEKNSTYEGAIRSKIETWWGSSEGINCAFIDIDGNGTDEMLLGSGSEFSGAYMMSENGGISIPGLWDDGTGRTLYICENGIIEIYKKNDEMEAHSYYQYDGSEAKAIITVVHHFCEEDTPWRTYKMDETGNTTWDPISQENYEETLSLYPRKEVLSIPVDDFLAQQ